MNGTLLPNIARHVHVLEPIASGRYGTVHRGLCARSGRMLAVKKVPVERQEMIMREAAAWTRVGRHPHVLALRDVYDNPGDNTVAFVSDLCRGGTLSSLETMETMETMENAFILEVLRQVLMALEHVHSKGVVHADIKPSNILLARANRPHPECRLADFGSSQMNALDDVDGVYKSFGTPMYAAPEMWITGSVCYGYNADVWSLGVMAFQLLSGTDFHPYFLHLEDDRISSHTAERGAWLRREFVCGMQCLPYINDRLMASRQNAVLKMLPRDNRYACDFVLECLQPKKALRPNASDLLSHPVFG